MPFDEARRPGPERGGAGSVSAAGAPPFASGAPPATTGAPPFASCACGAAGASCTAGTPPWLIYLCMALAGATSMGWNGVHMAELARVSPPALIGDVTSGASLFGFLGSICGPLVFAVIANRTGSFDWPFLLVAGQLAVSGAFALWYLRHRPL